MIVYLGSTRPAKVEGARDALAAIAAVDPRFAQAEIVIVDAGDAGPRMPMSEDAIVEGARLRTESLMAAHAPDGSRYFVGLEGGLDAVRLPHGHGYALKTWACVTDGRRWNYGAGGAVLLPDAISAAVVAGRELGDVVDELAGDGTRGSRGAWGVLTRDLIGRRDAFRTAVISAFAPFYNSAAYGRP
jgi:inosine/xanthosine triphosphatase